MSDYLPEKKTCSKNRKNKTKISAEKELWDMELRDKLAAARAKSKKLAALSTALLSLMSVMLMYLLFLSADNHRLLISLNKTLHNESQPEMDEADALVEELTDDLAWPGATNTSQLLNEALLLLRPHYSLFMPSSFSSSTPFVIEEPWLPALWLFSPHAVYVLVLQQHGIAPSGVVFSYAVMLCVLLVLKRWSSRFAAYAQLAELSLGRWLRGLLVRCIVFAALALHVSLKTWLDPASQSRVSSAFVLLFISACFLRGKSFLALLWCLLVSSLTQLAPFFRTAFALPWCPWLEDGVCQLQVGEFFVVSEFLLFVFSPIRVLLA